MRGLLIVVVFSCLLVIELHAQENAPTPLSLTQVEALITTGAPDAAVAGEIRRRGIGFSLTGDIIERLRKLGAGPETLEILHFWQPMVDEFDGSSVGKTFGIAYAPAINDLGAVFSRESESRIQYPIGIPSEGTLEFWIKVDHGYFYHDFTLHDNEGRALVFTTDIQGGDVSWPGSAWLYVRSTGDIIFNIGTAKYQSPPAQSLTAQGTRFRFHEWHALGISYGSRGQHIIVDGSVVASAPQNTQNLGRGGNHLSPVDIPTIGESVSGFWANNRYEGGFEGIVDRFRASPKQQDWFLARGPIPSPAETPTFYHPLMEGDYADGQSFKGTSLDPELIHLGKDYCVKNASVRGDSLKGTPFYAIGPGKVVDLRYSEPARRNDGVGNYVIVDHGNGAIAVYMHLAKVFVHIGQVVSPSAVLGEAGDRILHQDTCAHLHVEIRKGGISTLNVLPNMRFSYVSRNGTTRLDPPLGSESDVLVWIEQNFYDPDKVLKAR